MSIFWVRIMSGEKTGGSYINNTLAATQIRFCAFTVLKIKTFNFKNCLFLYQGSLVPDGRVVKWAEILLVE